MTKTEALEQIRKEIAKETGLPLTDIENSASFFSLGLDSISAVYVLDRLEKQLKTEMNPLLFWDYPTVEAFAEYLTSLKVNE